MVLHHDVSVSRRLQHLLGLRLLRCFLSVEIVNSGPDAGFHPALPMAGDRPSALALLGHSSGPSRRGKMEVRGAVKPAAAVATSWWGAVYQLGRAWRSVLALPLKDMECAEYRGSHDSRTWRVRFRDWGKHRRIADVGADRTSAHGRSTSDRPRLSCPITRRGMASPFAGAVGGVDTPVLDEVVRVADC